MLSATATAATPVAGLQTSITLPAETPILDSPQKQTRPPTWKAALISVQPFRQQWMTRSFAVALVFLERRVINGLTGWENLGIAATETVVWSCLALSLLLADIVLQWQETVRLRIPAAEARATTSSTQRAFVEAETHG